jgi:hypothetical protein
MDNRKVATNGALTLFEIGETGRGFVVLPDGRAGIEMPVGSFLSRGDWELVEDGSTTKLAPAGDLAKHEGPGPHPGTGSPQDVHGGSGGAFRGRGKKYNGLTGLLVGKAQRGKYSNSVDFFGVNVNPKREAEVKPEHDALWDYRRKQEAESRAASERRMENLGGDKPKLEDYGHVDLSISHSKDKSAGFPEGHPLADPETRVKVVNAAVQELSYSNSVGMGGALKQAAQGKTDGDLYQHFSKRLPAGVSLENVLSAAYQETQGVLDEIGAPEYFNLYHGSFSFTGNTEKIVNIGSDYTGFSSWSSSANKAAGFGSRVVFSQIPRDRLLVIPSQIPKQLAGVPSFLGGSRDESEYIIIHDDMFEWIEKGRNSKSQPAGDLAKHEGPGPHPGTGTSQDVHGGAGGAQPVSGREKGFESTAEKARRMLFEEENQEEVVTVKAEGHESKNFTLRDARRFLGEIHEDTWVDVTWVKQDQGLERFAGVPVYKATISHSGLYDPEQLAEKIKNDGLKMGTSWHNRPPSVYFTTSLEQAHKYATEYFTNADTSGGYGIVEF